MTAQHLAVSTVTEEDEFLALRDEWNHLAGASALASVFLRHEWHDAAWQWQRAEARLRLQCVRRAGRLVGICPLVLRPARYKWLPFRALEFLTVPDGQIAGVLADPRDLPGVVAAVVTALQESRGQWDALVLDKLPAEGGEAAVWLECAERAGCAGFRDEGGGNPFFRVDGDWATYYARRSRRLKKSSNAIGNQLRRAFGDIRVEHVAAPDLDAERAPELLEAAVGISARSWKRETGLSLDRPGPNAFIRLLTSHALEQGWLSLWFLHLNGAPVAMEYQLTEGGRVYALRSDFDDAYAAHSPGTFLNRQVMEGLFGGGVTGYYMGPGDNAYKMRWAEGEESLSRVVVYGRTWRGRLLRTAQRRLAPFARRLRGADSVAPDGSDDG
ncbi:MAG: GNAT family N-acetyltransferase [Deferrisomatales bacterium]